MMAMVKDGSFASTFSEEHAPIRNPMATKLLRFEAWKGHYNPLVADGDGGDGHQRFLRRDDNGISLYSEDTPRALSNFYATLVNYTDGPRAMTHVSGTTKRNQPRRRILESENPGERAHFVLEKGLPGNNYRPSKANLICHELAVRDNHRIDNDELMRVSSVPSSELRHFPSASIAYSADAEALACGMAPPWRHEREPRRTMDESIMPIIGTSNVVLLWSKFSVTRVTSDSRSWLRRTIRLPSRFSTATFFLRPAPPPRAPPPTPPRPTPLPPIPPPDRLYQRRPSRARRRK